MKNKKNKRIAVIGDSFSDEYIYGKVDRVSPEAPVPVLDVTKHEQRGGGAINVANNLYSLGIDLTLFTITSMKLPYRVVSPSGSNVLKKIRFIGNNFQLLRVDEPPVYMKKDLKRMVYPSFNDFDIIVFVDYNKGIIKGGKATIVDSKKRDLSVFKGTEYLKINKKEYAEAINKEIFPSAFITHAEKGINFYEEGKFKLNLPTQVKEVIDVTGAGDTVMATIIYCLVNGIIEPKLIMKLANKAAGIVVAKFGTATVSEKELLS